MNKYTTFQEAYDIVKNLKLINTNEWRNWIKNNKEYNIPYNPDIFYKNSGWINWKHFLNKEFKLDFISYDDAKEIVGKLNIENNKEFKKWIKNNKASRIPKAPELTYKNRGWISWGEFLSTKNRYKKDFIPYTNAVEFLKSFNLKSQNDYISFLKKDNIELPTNPHSYYKEWISWGKYLSSGVIRNCDKEFMNYEDSKKIVNALKFKNVKDFLEKRPIDIPSNPKLYYKEKWISWGEFLGTNRKSNKKRGNVFLNYEDAKLYLKNLNITHKYDYMDYIESNNIEFLPKRPDYIYRDEWVGYLEYLNCVGMRTSFGERKIKEFLDDNLIKYEREKKFDTCKNIKCLPFDFYLPDHNICIEYDGQQHFNIVSIYGGEDCLKKIQINDNIKNNWCSENNIKLIRISYIKKNKIYAILNEFFNNI
jgi:hypothetical protein